MYQINHVTIDGKKATREEEQYVKDDKNKNK